MNRSVWKAAFLATLPVLAGYSAMGCAFGILLDANAGLGAGWSFLMSLTILSGSLQFAAVDMIAGSLSLLEIGILTLFINFRYSMYGLSLIRRFREAGPRRWYLIFALTDETYALLLKNRPGAGPGDSDNFMLTLAALNHSYWVVGCVTGSIAGKLLQFNTRGIDFSMTALFLVILTDQCREIRNRIPALIGGAATLLCRVLFGPDNMLIPAMALILIGVLAFRRKLDPPEAEREGGRR